MEGKENWIGSLQSQYQITAYLDIGDIDIQGLHFTDENSESYSTEKLAKRPLNAA